jgi:cell pole-organizing protein PopZ
MINQETKTTESTFDHSEESMEEILASIRKIMSVTASETPQTKAPSFQPTALTPSVSAPTTLDTKKDILVLTKKLTLLEPKAPVASASAPVSSSVKEVKEAFARPESNNVFETIVSSSLTPLIQSWLDKNLETTVEKIVKEELKKFFGSASKTNS